MEHRTFRAAIANGLILCVTSLAASQSPPVANQSILPIVPAPETMLVALQAHVVQITAGAGGDTEGFGIIVGARDGELVVATAGHLIYTLGVPRSNIRVELHRGRGTPSVIAAATLLPGQPVFDKILLDLALLRVPTPFKPTLVPIAASPRPPVQGEPLWLLGSVNAFRWSATPGITGNVDKPEVVFTGGGVEQGASGAPVVSLGGIVGIARATGATSSAIPVAAIRRAFDQAATGYTWLLEARPEMPSPSYVFPTRLDRLPPGTGSPVLIGTTGREVVLAMDRWQEVPAGDYRLGGGLLGRLTCEPATVTIRPFKPRPLALSCLIDPVGLWRDTEGFRIAIAPSAGNRYSVRELDPSGVEIGSGDAVAFLDGRLQVNVISRLAGQWFADLTLEPDKATGRATFSNAGTVKEVTWFRSDAR